MVPLSATAGFLLGASRVCRGSVPGRRQQTHAEALPVLNDKEAHIRVYLNSNLKWPDPGAQPYVVGLNVTQNDGRY